MRRILSVGTFQIVFFVFIWLSSYVVNAQKIQVKIVGGAIVAPASTITITAGSSLNFRITNSETGNCDDLEVQSVTIANTPTFNVTPTGPSGSIKPVSCAQGWWYFFGVKSSLDFKVSNTSANCATESTLVTVKIKNKPNFTFTLRVDSSPKIHVLGGSPSADINHNNTENTDVNGTYFGIVEVGATKTRNYVISNTGSCPLTLSAPTRTGTNFTPANYVIRPNSTTSVFPVSINPGTYVVLPVSFVGPMSGSGTITSTISLANNDNGSFNFNVSAEMFNENIPGPGGISGDFRLWLKATRRVVRDSSSKVSEWQDLGTNLKSAMQAVPANQPTYKDDVASNINFNPVIKFQNGGGIEQFMYNTAPLSGFYSADIFIVMVPDATMTSTSPKTTIFGGVQSGSAGDVTGIGFGNYSTAFTNEVLSYNQNIVPPGTFNGTAERSTTKSYSGVGIINVTNNTLLSPTAQEILYNSNLLTTTKISNTFANINGSKYWIGKNYNQTANLNGRVAEIFTFETKLDAVSRQKVESYLAIKYGITLGASNQAQKNYINSFDTNVWDITANSGFNYDVTGIARDDESDLNQKQSKTANTVNAVTIGLGGIFPTNSANPNEFIEDGEYLMWGNNNGNFSGTSTINVTIGATTPTSLTRIDRTWKIVETIEGGAGDVDNIFVSIPAGAFIGFPKAADEEYALIVADNAAFGNADIIDVVPLVSDGAGNLQTWYDFDGIKFFTFGKVSKLTENHALTIDPDNYLLGEYAINLNISDFTISAWVKGDASKTTTRTIMSKGENFRCG